MEKQILNLFTKTICFLLEIVFVCLNLIVIALNKYFKSYLCTTKNMTFLNVYEQKLFVLILNNIQQQFMKKYIVKVIKVLMLK